MHLNQSDPQSGYDLHFESGPEGKSGIGRKGIDLYVERRLRVEELGRAYLSGETKRGARDDLVAALVSFDEVRAGELWDKEMSAGLADRYSKALSGKEGRLDPMQLGEPSGAVRLRRIPQPERFDQPFSPYDEPIKFRLLDLETQGLGWYYEKWFNYTGYTNIGYIQATHNMATRRLGLSVEASNSRPGHQDSLRVTSEAGFWFTYLPPADGYVECFFTMDAEWYDSFRDAFPGPSDKTLISHQCLQGVMGIRSGDMFFGRSYANAADSLYVGNGFSGTPDRYYSARLSTSFWLQSRVRVTAGTPIDLLFGMRTKILASMDEVGLDFWEQWRGSPSTVAVRTVPEWR